MFRVVRTVILTFVLTVLMSFVVFADDYKSVSDTYVNLGVVQCPKYLNIRQKPDKGSAVVGIIKTGAGCGVLQEGTNWCAVKSGDIYGYVMKEYLLTGSAAKTKANELATRRIKFISQGIVYSSMNTNSRVWERPVAGTCYDVTDDTGTWVKVDLDGGVGYVLADASIERFWGLDLASYTYDLTTVDGARCDIIKSAMRYLGNPYVWGGDNPNTGADCSGFVSYVYRKTAGIELPRCSYQQCYSGRRETSMEMQPGDLVFYADAGGTVGHVAMYIGNGTIIHAASTREGIKLSPWNYRTPKFIRNVLED